MRRWLLLLFIPWLLAVAPADLSDFAYQQHPGARLPLDARLVDETGRHLTLGELIGDRPVILVPGYFRCPNLCGVVRDDMFSALSRSGLTTPADYTLIALSIDPDETPADAAKAKADDLARYPTTGAEGGWHFVTGSAEEVGRIAQAVGFRSRYDPGFRQFVHPAGIVFITPGGTVAGYLLGVGYEPAALRINVAQAGAGRIARAALPVLLICFHYDPATGRYSFAIMRALELFAALTVLTLAVTLYFAHRRERRS